METSTLTLKKDFESLMQRKQADIDKGKVKTFRDINSEIKDKKHENYHEMQCKQFTYMQQINAPEKYYILERWERVAVVGDVYSKELAVGDVEYRMAYYIVSRKPKSKVEGKWVFGQFSPMIAHQDFMALIEKAKKEGTILQ